MSEQEQNTVPNPEDELEIQDPELDPQGGEPNPDPDNSNEEEFEIVVDGEEPPKQEDDPYRGQWVLMNSADSSMHYNSL